MSIKQEELENQQEELENDLDETTETSYINDKKESINNFVQQNGKNIIIFSIVIIILVGLVLLFRANSKKNEENAAKALARIESYYLRGKYESALYGNDTLPTVRGEKIIGLIDIINEYRSTSAGQRAALYAGDAYFTLGKYPEAKGFYEKAIKSNVDVVKSGGLAGSAACNEKDGKIKEAAEEYKKAADLIIEDFLKLRYLYFSALCNEKVGNNEEAKKMYRNIINLNKYGEFNNLAKAGIVRLGEDIE
jgi:tetratricopeptide (TPR) repeat protein